MKIHLRMLGCRLNQAEIDTMARQFIQQGHEIVNDATDADNVIVNTCAVTHGAERTSRKLIRELYRANSDTEITVTGCYAQIAPNDLLNMPEVAQVVDNVNKDAIVEQITGVAVEPFDHEPLNVDSNPGAAARTRAFVKVQDGCDNHCTFCVTTIARGDGHSREINDILDEIRYLHGVGFQEIVLTGVHLGSYGYDLDDKNGLLKLVQMILDETDIPRLRLSSLEPWDIAPQFFDLWQNKRLCRHLHLPLQSGCDATLKRMLRHTNQDEYRKLVNAARQRIPDISITTDIIVGFPGETDEEFTISREFIEEMSFAKMHIFRYSKRPGTAAARMKNHVSDDVQKERSAILHELSSRMSQQFAQRFSNQTRTVLWEQISGSTEDGFINVGYTDNYIRVRGINSRILSNQITRAKMLTYDDNLCQMTVEPSID